LTSVRLYVIPGSHPARAAELMLRHKGIEYKRTDLPPVISRFVVQRVLRFPGDRVQMAFADIEPAIAGRPAGKLAQRIAPDPPGRIGPAFPSEWLAPLRVAAAIP
jgi:hypothetical protein